MTRRIYDPNQAAFTDALEAVRAELTAIPGDQLEPIRLDIVDAIATALGVSPRVKALREQVALQFGEAAAVHIDRLEITARACARAHALHLTTLHGTSVTDMIDALNEKRKLLLLEAQALVSDKHLTPSVLVELVGGTGHKAMCLDVLQLVSALRAEWAVIESHTPVTATELDQAEALANAVLSTLGENEQATSLAAPTADLRRRAYTLFVRTYDEVRRLVTYFRWTDGDADEVAPSLFAGRARRSDVEEIVPVTPVNGSPTNGAPISPGMPGAPPFGPS